MNCDLALATSTNLQLRGSLVETSINYHSAILGGQIPDSLPKYSSKIMIFILNTIVSKWGWGAALPYYVANECVYCLDLADL